MITAVTHNCCYTVIFLKISLIIIQTSIEKTKKNISDFRSQASWVKNWNTNCKTIKVLYIKSTSLYIVTQQLRLSRVIWSSSEHIFWTNSNKNMRVLRTCTVTCVDRKGRCRGAKKALRMSLILRLQGSSGWLLQNIYSLSIWRTNVGNSQVGVNQLV